MIKEASDHHTHLPINCYGLEIFIFTPSGVARVGSLVVPSVEERIIINPSFWIINIMK